MSNVPIECDGARRLEYAAIERARGLSLLEENVMLRARDAKLVEARAKVGECIEELIRLRAKVEALIKAGDAVGLAARHLEDWGNDEMCAALETWQEAKDG